MSPLNFVGAPDWRSAVLAALLALPWLYLLGRGRLRQWPLWVGLALAAVLFPLAIALVQVPLQGLLSLLWLGAIGEEAIKRLLPLVALPSLIVASLVQEGLKLLAAMLALRLLRQRDPQSGLAAGAAAGAGLGGFEAFWVFNTIFASGWTWGSVQLGGAAALLGFVERFLAVPFHAGSGAICGYGYGAGRTWRYLGLAVALHTALNYGVVLLQMGLLDMMTVEVWTAVWAAVTMAIAFRLRRRAVQGVRLTLRQ